MLASELKDPFDAMSVQFPAATTNQGWFADFSLRACRTSLSELTPSFAANYDGNTPVTVMARDTLYLEWQNGEWEELAFDVPFSYNGVDNLILETRWQGDDDGTLYVYGWYPPGGNRMLTAGPDDSTGSTSEHMNRLRICFPTGTGAPALLSPPFDGPGCSPDPCRLATAVRFGLDRAAPASVDIFDALGRTVRALHRGRLASGRHSLTWDLADDRGLAVPAGIYFCRITAGTAPVTLAITVLD